LKRQENPASNDAGRDSWNFENGLSSYSSSLEFFFKLHLFSCSLLPRKCCSAHRNFGEVLRTAMPVAGETENNRCDRYFECGQ
jgi:hypothetical protein